MTPSQAIEARREALDLAAEFMNGQGDFPLDVRQADQRDALVDLAAFLAPAESL